VKRIIGVMRESLTPVCLVLVIIAVLLLSLPGRTQGGGMTQLEARIVKTLSQIEGVGKVSIVIRTVKQTGQSKLLGAYSAGEEVPCGAVAVAEGGENPLIRSRLTGALCALLGLHASQVDVIGMNGGE